MRNYNIYEWNDNDAANTGLYIYHYTTSDNTVYIEIFGTRELDGVTTFICQGQKFITPEGLSLNMTTHGNMVSVVLENTAYTFQIEQFDTEISGTFIRNWYRLLINGVEQNRWNIDDRQADYKFILIFNDIFAPTETYPSGYLNNVAVYYQEIYDNQVFKYAVIQGGRIAPFISFDEYVEAVGSILSPNPKKGAFEDKNYVTNDNFIKSTFSQYKYGFKKEFVNTGITEISKTQSLTFDNASYSYFRLYITSSRNNESVSIMQFELDYVEKGELETNAEFIARRGGQPTIPEQPI